MNYIGSKYSLLPFLEREILGFSGSGRDRTFVDIFAGTGAVGQHFKSLGFEIIANDVQYYSYCLNRTYIGISPQFSGLVQTLPKPRQLLYDSADTVLEYLCQIQGVEGFVFNNYCAGGTAQAPRSRLYFTDENGQRCDAIRLQIEQWHEENRISEDEYYYLLTSLLEAIDKVANTASVYAAFLKHIKRSASKPLKLERVAIVPNHKIHQVYNRDGVALVKDLHCDILYIDPPYNHRQYATNYHVLETIARYDSPRLHGVTGLRDYEDQKSKFCYKNTVQGALDELVKGTRARYIFLSYNSEGLMSAEQIAAIMERYGRLELRTRNHRRFRADKDQKNRQYKTDSVVEYLFCLDRCGTC